MEDISKERLQELIDWGKQEESYLEEQHKEAIAWTLARLKILDSKYNYTKEQQEYLNRITEERLNSCR